MCCIFKNDIFYTDKHAIDKISNCLKIQKQ